MTKISRSSSLKNSRYQLQYTNSINNPGGVRKVDPADPIRKVRNHTEHPSDHQLDFFNNYYQSIAELKKEFKDFYHDERALSTALASTKDTCEPFESKMRLLIDKYNNALDSLKALDEAVQSSHTIRVKKALAEYHPTLQEYGVHEISDGNIDLDSLAFQKKLQSTGDQAALFIPLKDVILSIHRVLHSIRIPKDKNQTRYSSPQPEMRGLFIENKL